MKETTKRSLLIGGSIIGFILVILLLTIPFLSRFLMKTLMTKIETAANLKINYTSTNIGFFSSEIEGLRILKGNSIILDCDHIRARYYLFGLLGLKELKISGFRLHLDNIQKENFKSKTNQDGRRSFLPEPSSVKNIITDFKNQIRKLSNGINASPLRFFLSDSALKISGGQIYFLMNDDQKRMIPFSADFQIGRKDGLINCKIVSEPFSGNLELSGLFEKNAEIKISAKGNNISISQITELCSGSLNFSLESFASPSKIQNSLTFDLSRFTYSTNQFRIASSADHNIKLNLGLDETDGKFSVEKIFFESPLEMNVSFEDGKILLNDNNIEALGSLLIQIPQNATIAKSVHFGQFKIILPVKAIWDEEGIKITIKNEFSEEKVSAKFANAEFSTKLNELSAEILYKDALSGTAKLKLSENILVFADSKIKIPLLDINSEFEEKKISASAKFADGIYEKDNIRVSGISASALFNSSDNIENNQIEINCGEIVLSGKDYGNLQFLGKFDFDKILLKGNYDLGHKSGFKLPLEIVYKRDGNFIRVNASHGDNYIGVKFPDMGVLSDALRGYSFEGSLKMDYLYESKFGVFSGKFSKDIKDGVLVSSDRGLRVEGISGHFRSDDPFVRKSLPRQEFYAKKLLFGKSELTDIILVYALEDKTTFFIENLSAGWCGGKLYVSSARFDSSPQKKITVLFDRILLSRLLGEFGIGEAAGEGRVNGRVPISYNAGKIDFQDAFFYSTPGLGGNIKVKKAGTFLDSIPRDGEQFSNIDLTLEALKDFDYDWSKISLQSEGEQLLAKFEFLGKPRNPLPFRYNPEKGIFKRVDIETAGTIFQGIKLDLNCRLPLNEILRYITIFKNFLTEKGVPL